MLKYNLILKQRLLLPHSVRCEVGMWNHITAPAPGLPGPPSTSDHWQGPRAGRAHHGHREVPEAGRSTPPQGPRAPSSSERSSWAVVCSPEFIAAGSTRLLLSLKRGRRILLAPQPCTAPSPGHLCAMLFPDEGVGMATAVSQEAAALVGLWP